MDQIINGEDARCDEPIKPCDEDPEQALCKYRRQVDVYQMEAGLSVGPVFARHIGHRMYRGEYYSTQSDAHVTFTRGWDVDILDQMDSTHNDMAVLTTYLTDIQGSIGANGESLRHTRPIMCNTYYEGGAQGDHLRHGSQPERMPSIHGSPQLQPWWAAGYSFSRGHFVVNVPYDPYQPMIFQGEEMSIGIRGYTIGYDFYTPERSVCFHHYAVGKNAKLRNKVHHFWENEQYAGYVHTTVDTTTATTTVVTAVFPILCIHVVVGNGRMDESIVYSLFRVFLCCYSIIQYRQKGHGSIAGYRSHEPRSRSVQMGSPGRRPIRTWWCAFA